MASLTQRCIDFLKGWTQSVDELISNPVLSKAEAGAALSEASEKGLKYPSVRENIGAFIRNSYLSALSTHVINVVSQTAQLAIAPIVRSVAGSPGEGMAMLRGVAEGFMEAYPRFVAGLSKRREDFDGNEKQAYDIVKNETADKILTFPTTLTGALDSAFSAVLERMEFRAMIHRINNKFPDEYFQRMGTTREAFVKELDDIAMKKKDGNALMLRMLEDKDPALRNQLENFAAFNTFRTPLGNSLFDKAGKVIAKGKKIAPELNLVIPFLRTGINIAKEAGGYVPGGGVLRAMQAKKDIAEMNGILSKLTAKREKLKDAVDNAVFPGQKAKAEENFNINEKKIYKLEGELAFKKEKIPEFYAQQAIGAGMMLGTIAMVDAGLITGHYSSNPGIRERQIASKIPPMSVKLGDRWVSYARIEPLSSIMGLTVDTINQFKEGNYKDKEANVAVILAKVLSENFLDKTFTEGLGKMILAVQEPDRYFQSFMVGLTSPIVPAIVNQVARLEDPVRREVKDPELSNWILNNLKSRIPGLKETLPAQVDLLGQEKTQGTGFILSGIETAPVARDATRTIFDNPYLSMERMDRKVGGLEIPPDLYVGMENRVGDQLNQVAQILVNNPGYNALPRPMQALFVKRIAEDLRRNERLRMLSELVQDPAQRAIYIQKELTKRGMQADVDE
jgi:hypothetical protein